MIDPFKTWWKSRTIREQRLVLLASAISAIVLAWLLVIYPVSLALDAAKARHGEAAILYSQVTTEAETLAEFHQGTRQPFEGDLRDFMTAETTRAGFSVAQTDTVGTTSVRVAIPAARPQIFFGWIEQLERRDDLIIESVVARPNADETLGVELIVSGVR